MSKNSPVSNLISIFLSNYMGWGVTVNSVCVIILGYTEFSKQEWGDKPIKVIPNNEALTYLIQMNKELLPTIENNHFNIYVKHYTKNLTDIKTFFWYCNLRPHLKLQLFTSFLLDEVAILLNISKKRIANFNKTMKDLTSLQRVEGYPNWHNNYVKNILGK